MRDKNQCLHGRDAHAPLAFASHTLSSNFRISEARDKQLHIYQDTHHLLWPDWDKETVLSDIHAWLTERI